VLVESGEHWDADTAIIRQALAVLASAGLADADRPVAGGG
jgi:hypothetical protein